MGSMKHPKYRLLKKTNGKSSPFYSFFKYIYIIYEYIHFLVAVSIKTSILSHEISSLWWVWYHLFFLGDLCISPKLGGLSGLQICRGCWWGNSNFPRPQKIGCLKFQWLTFWKLWHWWQFANWNMAHRNSWFTELKDGGSFHSYVNVYQGVNPIRSH